MKNFMSFDGPQYLAVGSLPFYGSVKAKEEKEKKKLK